MECKIGEIREVNGEWYQCVAAIDGCRECSFRRPGYCTRHSECLLTERSDKTSVIFKKLEKTGEPLKINGKVYQGLISPYEFNNCSLCAFRNISCKEEIPCYDDYIFIEIKQNKEDMEEKKQKLDKLVDDYMACRIQYAEFDKELKALYDKEESKPTLKEFSLEAAKAGKPVCTRDGRKARIICFDSTLENYPLVVLVGDYPYSYTDEGKFNKDSESNSDLMMLPKKKEGWVNVYKHNLYDTESEAKRAHVKEGYIDTIKIEWEE